MCRYRHHFFSFITVIDICDLIVTHIICLINNYNTNTNTNTKDLTRKIEQKIVNYSLHCYCALKSGSYVIEFYQFDTCYFETDYPYVRFSKEFCNIAQF